MDIYSLIDKNRSYRSFDESKPVTREVMLRFIDASRHTASSVNLQPLRYKIVSERAELDFMRANTRWAAKLKNYDGPAAGHCPTGYIIVCLDADIAKSIAPFDRDVGIAAQTILLCACEEGFGGCMIGSYDDAAIRTKFAFPENMLIRLVIALGTPDENVILEESNGDVCYYRDNNNIHHVPKRSLESILM